MIEFKICLQCKQPYQRKPRRHITDWTRQKFCSQSCRTIFSNTTHGMEGNRFNKIFWNIRQRCFNPSCISYKNYGGRGIKTTWKTFDEFTKDMYQSYLEHVSIHGEKNTFIERIDNNGPYTFKNCRWETRYGQARNKRNSTFITYEGRTMCITDWATHLKMHYKTLRDRLHKLGWDTQRALTTPVRKMRFD